MEFRGWASPFNVILIASVHRSVEDAPGIMRLRRVANLSGVRELPSCIPS